MADANKKIKRAPDWFCLVAPGEPGARYDTYHPTEKQAKEKYLELKKEYPNLEEDIYKERCLPAGRYFVGDPYLVLTDYKYANKYERGNDTYQLEDGTYFALFKAALGPGTYPSDTGESYKTESGDIIIYPVGLLKREKVNELVDAKESRIVHTSKALDVGYDRQCDGCIDWGGLFIFTGIENWVDIDEEDTEFSSTPLGEAFQNLERRGIKTMMNCGFTRSDGESIMEGEPDECVYKCPYAFIDTQNMQYLCEENSCELHFSPGFIEEDDYERSHYLRTEIEFGKEICEVLVKYEIKADFDSTFPYRIKIDLPYNYKDYCSFTDLIYDINIYTIEKDSVDEMLLRFICKNLEEACREGDYQINDLTIGEEEKEEWSENLMETINLVFNTSKQDFWERFSELLEQEDWSKYGRVFGNVTDEQKAEYIDSIDWDGAWDTVHQYCDEETIQMRISKVLEIDLEDVLFEQEIGLEEENEDEDEDEDEDEFYDRDSQTLI